jgi:hypothetical protein
MSSLANKSGIIKLKSKFFLNRALTYFSFLLIPLFLPQAKGVSTALQTLLMLLYVIFMSAQWYLLGKEIDHRLKIYFRANSSIDRILYRLVLGYIILLIYFNMINLLPEFAHQSFFWGTWIVLGLFYSWPTRGKIIEESVTSQLEEFKFLDSFERTVTGMSLIMFLVSIPEIASFGNIEVIKLYFDPNESFHGQFWNFLNINYLPFRAYPKLFSLSWSLHFYFVGMGFYLLSLYGILRFFVSRRLSILGVFAALSTWSFVKILEFDVNASVTTTFSILWIWSLMFCTKSSTYRAGLFIGLVNYLGCLLNPSYIVLLPIQLILIYLFLIRERTKWYRKQTLKYSIMGSFLSIIAFFSHGEEKKFFNQLKFDELLSMVGTYLEQKAFFWLSAFGLILAIMYSFTKMRIKFFNGLRLDVFKLNELMISISIIVILSLVLEKDLLRFFGLIWIFYYL